MSKKIQPTISVSDTDATNTRRKNGVIARLKYHFPSLVYEPCSLHILDLILKHAFAERFAEKSSSSAILYNCFENTKENWLSLKTRYILIKIHSGGLMVICKTTEKK